MGFRKTNISIPVDFSPIAASFGQRVIILLLFLSFTATSQSTVAPSTRISNLPTYHLNINGGIHMGIFDCNQTNKFPINIGGDASIDYQPLISLPVSVGANIGIFKIFGAENPKIWGRIIDMSMMEFFPFISYAFPVNSQSYNYSIGLGVPYVKVLESKSSGRGYKEPDASFGIGIFGAIGLPNRLTINASVYRLNKDLDGFGYDEKGKVADWNSQQLTYIMKLGVMYNLISK